MGYSLICPFCRSLVAAEHATVRTIYLSFFSTVPHESKEKGAFSITFLRCPSCDRISSKAIGTGPDTAGLNIPLLPPSSAIKFPEYIPQSIRADYEEAISILQLSPKASATLSRRCLQGMIRDFWGVRCSTLSQEINSLKNKIPSNHWKAIDALRKIGNIGAHMEKDVNLILDITPEEAEKLLWLIEFLLRGWYVERHESNQLLDHITKIADNFSSQRQQGQTPPADPLSGSNTGAQTGPDLPPSPLRE